jgi:mannose-6-phosphate isomerase-like protein (cupin superfamily)
VNVHFVLRGRPDLDEYVKQGAGFALRVLKPGRPAGMYHAESVEEDFLVLMGECVLIIEDQERHLGPGTSCIARPVRRTPSSAPATAPVCSSALATATSTTRRSGA